MKKLAILSVLATVALVSCGGGKSSEDQAADSARQADSIAALQAASETARLDVLRQDSIQKAEADKMYDNALTVVPGKKKTKQCPTAECNSITLPLSITNNTDIPLEPADYSITYVEEYEVCSDGSMPNRFNNKKAASKPIKPGETITVTLHESCSWDIIKPKVKLKISKEEFLNRRKQNIRPE